MLREATNAQMTWKHPLTSWRHSSKSAVSFERYLRFKVPIACTVTSLFSSLEILVSFFSCLYQLWVH